MDSIKFTQAIVATVVAVLATLAASPWLGSILSGDALVGLYGAIIGYIFGDSTARRDAQSAGRAAVREAESLISLLETRATERSEHRDR